MTPAEWDRLPHGLQARALCFFTSEDCEYIARAVEDAPAVYVSPDLPRSWRAVARFYRRKAKAVRPRSLLKNGRAYRGY